jgi:hypothetical protein
LAGIILKNKNCQVPVKDRKMKLNITIAILTMAFCALVIVVPAQAYVIPQIGGGQQSGFPMVMVEVFFDGQSIFVFDEYVHPWSTLAWSAAPFLRPLVPPAAFDPTKSWKVLIGKAYNFQYGWDAALLDEYTYPFPPGSAVWVKVLDQTPELETYYRDAAYAPIFGTPDVCGIPSSDIWKWDKGMRHNTYAVADTFYGRLYADYKVYLGNATTGAELVDSGDNPIYGSALVTFRWLRPCPYILEGDINYDCVVDFYDYTLLADQWHGSCSYPYWCDEADIDQSTAVDLMDLYLLAQNWLIDCQQTPSDPQCVTRPGPL